MRNKSARKQIKAPEVVTVQEDVTACAAQFEQKNVTAPSMKHATGQTHFYLSTEKWNEFCAALGAPPQEKPQLKKLLTEPSVLGPYLET